MKFPALFLDRDGVIMENRANYVRSWTDVEFFPKALQALANYRSIPHKIFIVTNQSAVGRGIMSLETAVSLNNQIIDVVREHNGRIDDAYLCPDPPGINSTCRKPAPGMLLQAAEEHQIDLSQSIMIGDALTDVEAGQAAGVKTAVLLLTGRGKVQFSLPKRHELPPFKVFHDLSSALDNILKTNHIEPSSQE